MAGHSKWANIQHRKGRQDEKRGKVWTRVIREITVAARQGGGDLAMNPRLRLAVEKAKAVNMPADTIRKNVDKATGALEGISYEEVRYEGYGIGGAAVIVDTMTDNRVRTVAEVRHAFSKYGGNLGAENSVAFQFRHVAQFLFAPGATSTSSTPGDCSSRHASACSRPPPPTTSSFKGSRSRRCGAPPARRRDPR